MAQGAIGAPFFRQLHHGARQVAVKLLELGFETREKCESIGRGTGKTGDNLVVIKTPELLGGALEDLGAEGDLPVAGHHYFAVSADTNHRRRPYSWFHCWRNPILT